MIAVDTNILVRFLVRDDKKQAETVRKRLKRAEINRERLWIPLLVVLETLWVLESVYGKRRKEILNAVRDLRQLTVFEFESDAVVEQWIREGEKRTGDLSDLLIAESAEHKGCSVCLTFDKKASKAPFFELLK